MQRAKSMKLFLGGDLMVGRGIDQVLRHPVDPRLYESWIRDARDYVRLAERVSGPLPRGVAPETPWGEALALLDAEAPDARIVNLETSITARGDHEPAKGIHYRLSPANADVLRAARLDVCALANNHVLDWGPDGLADTLATLEALGITACGAGRTLAEARARAEVDRGGRGRALVSSVGVGTSGIPGAWAATPRRAGVDRLPDLSPATAEEVAHRATSGRREGDVVVVSVHWGDNWGHEVGDDEVDFAHRLIEGGVDVVHGHSSHHPRPVEIWRDRLVLYGCGELLDDYEGISGYEAFRPELVLLWLPTLARDGRLEGLRAWPMRIRRLRLKRATAEEAAWLAATLAQTSLPFGTSVALDADGALRIT